MFQMGQGPGTECRCYFNKIGNTEVQDEHYSEWNFAEAQRMQDSDNMLYLKQMGVGMWGEGDDKVTVGIKQL